MNDKYENIAESIGIENKIEVIDDFLSKEKFQILQEFMMGDLFPWYRNEGVNMIGDGHRQFIHIFYADHQKKSWAFDSILPIIEKIDPFAILRIKGNLLPKTQTIHEFEYHCDYLQPCVTGIFYINTNNGYTFFKTGQKINSIQNRFVRFPSYMYHAGTTCTDAHDRIVINFNYFVKKNLWT